MSKWRSNYLKWEDDLNVCERESERDAERERGEREVEQKKT